MIRKIVPILVIALFMISFASVAVSAEEQNTITGTIIAMETGKVSVQDEAGTIHTLTAGSDIDLGTLSRGDKVIIKEGGDGVIKSITKQE